MLKGILFDWDGVLVDSVPDVYRGFCHVCKMDGGGITPVSFETFCQTYAAPYLPYYRRLGVTASDTDILRWYWEATNHEEQPLFFDVVSVVELLASRGIVMGIISAHGLTKVEARCRDAGLSMHMAMIVGDAHDKVSSIQGFCIERRIRSSQTGYVGDFVSDMRDARAAGVVPIGATRGKNTEIVLRRHGADYCVSNLHELIDLL